MQREHLSSRLGFILLSAGCAIGIGNVWKFPWLAGQNGGGFFVLLYLFFLALMGIPVMTMEFAMGRAAQKSPVKLYDELEPKGTKWHYHGYAALAGNYLLMMFYTSVSAWIFYYAISSASGKLENLNEESASAIFVGMLENLPIMIVLVAAVIIIGFVVCSFGLQKGLERVTKYMMLALLVIMVVLAINSCFLEGGREGLEFYLKPSIENMKEAGIGNVIVNAMNQAFFTLSLGIGAMAIFGSYLNKDRALMGEAVNVAVLDTLVALCSGLIIFPACSAYGVDVGAGPVLIFQTLPRVFDGLPFGRVWGTLFFIFLAFAAMSTIFAVFEGIVACTTDLTGWSKKKACLVNGIAMMILSLPCIFGYNIWSGFMPFGEGSSVLDLEDFLVSNILLPLGSLIFVIFCTSKLGWGWNNFRKEANSGRGLKVPNQMKFYCTYILPVIILVLFVIGLYNFFK